MNNNALKEFDHQLPDHSCISKIMKMDRTSLTEKEQFHVDIFLLSYYTGGSTISELASLRWSDIEGKHTIIKRNCLGKTAKIPNYTEYVDIVEKYGDQCYGDYLLPIFTHKHITEEQQAGRVKRFSEEMNTTLKKVTTIVDAKSDITIGSVRRIFIELMLWSGAKLEDISLWVGCSIDTVCRYHERMVEISRQMDK